MKIFSLFTHIFLIFLVQVFELKSIELIYDLVSRNIRVSPEKIRLLFILSALAVQVLKGKPILNFLA